MDFFFNVLEKKSTEISYNTFNNKLLRYFDEGNVLLTQYRGSFGIIYHPDIYNKHFISVYYNSNAIKPYVLEELNSDFLSDKIKQRYITLDYTYSYDKRDFKIYPNKGYYLEAELTQSGIGFFDDLSLLIARSKIEKYFQLSKNIFSGFKLEGKKTLYSHGAGYINNIALGYDENYLNGYELYVIDGEDYVTLKTSHKVFLFKGKANLSKWIKISQFKFIPYDFYLSLNADCGYVNNNTNFVFNNFTNRWLYGYGLSLDALIYHNLLKISYGINHTGAGGFYFHFVNNI